MKGQRRQQRNSDKKNVSAEAVDAKTNTVFVLQRATSVQLNVYAKIVKTVISQTVKQKFNQIDRKIYNLILRELISMNYCPKKWNSNLHFYLFEKPKQSSKGIFVYLFLS